MKFVAVGGQQRRRCTLAEIVFLLSTHWTVSSSKSTPCGTAGLEISDDTHCPSRAFTYRVKIIQVFVCWSELPEVVETNPA